MSLRQDLKSLQIKKHPPYYLVFFKEDRSLGVAKANNIIELDKEDLLEPGTECHVRSKKMYLMELW
uniref:Uncharacterized protein n=1 Tax=Amphimedon queenslandica TaxID=400682 RepID=A0A1X7T7N6_AMPQE